MANGIRKGQNMTTTIPPLVVRCPGAGMDNPSLTGGASKSTLQVQMGINIPETQLATADELIQ